MKNSKAPKIKAALLKGMSASAIAKKYDVTPSYVYMVRKRMQSVPPQAKPPRRQSVVKVTLKKPEPLPQPVVEPVPVPQFLREDPTPTPAPTVLVAPRGAWQRLKDFLLGLK